MLVKMSYGYRVRLAPIQMITFYNAIANGGKMISPVLIRELRRGGARRVERSRDGGRMAYVDLLARRRLRRSVQRVPSKWSARPGTAKPSLPSDSTTLCAMAGKTGTAQFAQDGPAYPARRYDLGSMVALLSRPTNPRRYGADGDRSPGADGARAYYGGPVWRARGRNSRWSTTSTTVSREWDRAGVERALSGTLHYAGARSRAATSP